MIHYPPIISYYGCFSERTVDLHIPENKRTLDAIEAFCSFVKDGVESFSTD